METMKHLNINESTPTDQSASWTQQRWLKNSAGVWNIQIKSLGEEIYFQKCAVNSNLITPQLPQHGDTWAFKVRWKINSMQARGRMCLCSSSVINRTELHLQERVRRKNNSLLSLTLHKQSNEIHTKNELIRIKWVKKEPGLMVKPVRVCFSRAWERALCL